MSERIGSGKTDPNFIKDAMGDLAKAGMTGKDTIETHKSTTIIETKVEGAGKAEKELKKVADAAKEVAKAGQQAKVNVSPLDTAKQRLTKTVFKQKQDKNGKTVKALSPSAIKAMSYFQESDVIFESMEEALGIVTAGIGNGITEEDYTSAAKDLVISFRAYQTMLGDAFSLPELEQELPGIADQISKLQANVKVSAEAVNNVFANMNTILQEEGVEGLEKFVQTLLKGQEDALDIVLQSGDSISSWNKLKMENLPLKYKAKASSKDRQKDFVQEMQKAYASMASPEAAEALETMVISEWMKKIASSKNPKQERALYFKNGIPIDKEILGGQGAVPISLSDAKTLGATTIAHSHGYDSSIDYLGFSTKDIMTLISPGVQRAILTCGDEMLSMDFGSMPDSEKEVVKQMIVQMYHAAATAFGAQISINENGFSADATNLSTEAQNELNNFLNYYISETLAGYSEKYGSKMTSLKFGADGTVSSTTESRLGKGEQYFKQIIPFAKAFDNTQVMDQAFVNRMLDLQKAGSIKIGIDTTGAVAQVEEVTKALETETHQAEQAEQANQKVFEPLTRAQLKEQLDKEAESFKLETEPDWKQLDKTYGIPTTPTAKSRPKEIMALMKAKTLEGSADTQLEKALMAREENDEKGYESAKKSYIYLKKIQDHYRDELLRANSTEQTAAAHEHAAQAAEKHAEAEKKVSEAAQAEENSLDAVRRIMRENETAFTSPMDKVFEKYGINEDNGKDVDFLKGRLSAARENKSTGLARAKQAYEWAKGKDVDPLKVKNFKEGIQQYIDANNLILRLKSQISSLENPQASQSVEAQAQAHEHAAQAAQQHAEAEHQVTEASSEQKKTDTTNQSATNHEEAAKAAEKHAEAEHQVAQAEEQVAEEAKRIQEAIDLGNIDITSIAQLEKYLHENRSRYQTLSSEEALGQYVNVKAANSKNLKDQNRIYRGGLINAENDANDYSALALEELSKKGNTPRYRELASAYLNASQAASELRSKVAEIADEEARITEEKARQERASKTIEDIETLIQERKNHYDVGDLTHAIGPYQDSDFQAKSITTRKHAYNAALDEALNDQSNALSNVFMEYQANGFTAEFDELAIKYTSVSKAVEEFRRQLAILAEQEKQEAEAAKQAEEARQREAEKAQQAAEAAKQQTQEKEKQAEAEKKVTAEKQKQQTTQPTPPSSGTPSGSSSSSQVSPAALDSYKQEKQILTEIYTLEKNLIGASGEKEKALLRAKTLREQEAKALRDQRKADGLYDKNETMKLATWAKEQRRKVDLGKELANAKLAEKATIDRENRLAKIRKEHADALVKAQKDQELVTKKVEKAEISERDKQVKASYGKEKKYLIELNRLRMESIKTKSKEEDAVNKKQIDATQKQIELLRQQRKAEELIDSDREKQLLQSQSASENQYRKKLTDDFNYRFENVAPWINGLSNYEFVGEKAHEYVNTISDLQKRMSEVNSLSQNINWGDTSSIEKLHQALVELERDYQTFSQTLATGEGVKANQEVVNKLTASISAYQQKNTKLTAEEVNELNNMKTALKDCDQMTLGKISTQFDQLKTRIKATGREGVSFTTQLGKKFREMTTYFMSFASVYRIIGTIKEGLGIIKDLDTALTEMQKVSDESMSTLQQYQTESYNIADSAGTTGLIIQQSTADFMRLGQSLEEASESAKNASILLNVSEFENISDATDSLIAMHAAFDDVAQDDIIDKLNNVGNNYAISTDGLATALQNSASALRTAGNDIDESIAVITAGNQVVQDPSKVGNAARFIALRITGTEEAKEELQNMGEEVDDFVVQTSAKSQQIIKDYTAVASNAFKGVDILDENGNFKSTYQILQEIADVYEEIVETDKKYGTNRSQGLIEALGGKNRANVVASILQSPDVLRNAYESSQNSFGSAEEELEKYKDSISGHIAEIQNKWQQAWANTANRDQINFFIDMGSAIMDLVNKIGLIPSALTALGTVYGIMGIAMKKDTNVITLLTSAFQSLGKTAFTVTKPLTGVAKGMQTLATMEDELDDAVEAASQGFIVMGKSSTAAATTVGVSWLTVIGVLAGVGAAIAGLLKIHYEYSTATSDLVKRNQRLIESDKKKVQALQEEKQGYDDDAKSLSDLLTRYQEAEAGSEEYYNIRQQIADQFPQLIVGYDSEGNAIIATNDLIQQQIDKYKELSLAKQEALKEQARENIQKETGEKDTDAGQESYAELVSKRKNLQADLDKINSKINSKDFVTRDEKYEYKGSRYRIKKGMEDTYTEAELNNEKTRILGELSGLNNQIGEQQSSLRENYALLVGDIDEGNEQLVTAVGNLENIASRAGVSDLQFDSMFQKLKWTDFDKEGNVGEIMQNLLTPDTTTIKASEYSDKMNEYLNQLMSDFHLDENTRNTLMEALDITSNTNLIESSIKGIEEQYGAQLQELGIDYTSWLQEANVSDVLGFNITDFLSETFPKQVTDKYKDSLDDIKELTVSELSGIDWNQAVTDPALKSFRGLANMAVGWGLADNIQEAINLFGQMGLVVDDSVEGMKTQFENFSTSFEESMTQMNTASDKVKTALSEQTSQGSISADTYKELIAANADYKDAIIETATGIQLNTDKVKELQDQEKSDLTNKLTKEQQELYVQFNNNEAEIARLTQKLKDHNFVGEETAESVTNQISSLNEVQATLQDNISTWALYRDQLLAATNAWNEWQTAQASANASDPYKSMKSAWDSFKEAHEQGWVGTDDYLSYARLLTGVTDEDTLMSDKLFEQAKKTQERYFTDNIQGVYNFMNDAEEVLKKNGLTDWFTEEGGLQIKNDELFTSLFSEYMQGKGMAGISLEGLQQIMAAVKDAGWGDLEAWGTYADQASYIQDSITWMEKQQAELEESDPKWQQYADMIANANQQLTELEIKQKQFKTPEELNELNTIANNAGTATQVELPTNFSTADQAQDALTQLGMQKVQMVEMGIDVNSEQYQAVLAEIDYVYAQWQKLSEPAIMQIDSSQLDEVDGQYVQLVQDAVAAAEAYQSALHQFQNGTGDMATVNAAKSSADAKASLVQSFEGEHPELKVKLGLEEGTMTELNGKIAESGDQLAEAFKIDDNVMSGVIKSIDDTGVSADTAKGKIEGMGTAITTLPTVGNLGFTTLNSYVSTANTNVGNLAGKINNLPSKKTVEISVKTSGSVPKGITGLHGTTGFSSGTAKFHPFGKAAAQGDIGAKKTETALVGELGPEMRVRGSHWELLGENGAEFSDIRRGDIIFNHKQTAELLRNGYISSRGQMAFAGGTAFAGKSKDWKNADNVKRAKSSSSSSKTSTKSKDSGDSKSKSKDKDDKKKTSKLQDWLGKLFDWIEVKLDRTQKAIDNAISKAESYVSMIPATLDRITTGTNGLFDANRYKETADEVARYVAKAIGQYTDALSSTYSQISTQNQAVTKYESLASTARKKGLSGLSSKNKKTAKKALKILDRDGAIDVSKYNDKVKEVIEGVKQWKDKAIEARAAINDLNDKVRDYVKSLKETVDAQRDAHTSLAEWSVSSVNATFEATNDNNADYSKSRLDLENNQLMVQNKAYAQATSTMGGQVTSIGKTASKVGMYDGLSKKQQKAIKKNKKGKKAYTTALDNAKKAIKAQKEISLSDLDTIQKYNPTVYAKMIAWNEALNQLDITRQEEITAYTQNYNKIAENIVEKYNKMDEATNNDIELYTKQIDNATSDNGKNELLQKQINKSQELRAHAQSRVADFNDLKKNSASRINNFTKGSMRTSKSMTDSDSKIINALFSRIQNTVKSGKAISASDLNTVFELYRKGYIQASYYKACTDWNISVERLEEAKRAQLLVEETVRQENATRELQKIQNIQQQSENNRQMNEQRKTEANARISKAEAYGHYAKPEDYTAQIEKENSNLQDLIAKREEARKVLEESIKAGTIRIGDDEWYEAVNVINSMTNAINETDLSVKNLKNSLRQLNWDIFDDGMKEIAKLNTEIEHYLNIIGNEQFFDEDDRGNITQYGLAALEAHNTAYELNIQQAKKYAQEVEELQKRFKLAKEDENWLDSTDAKNQERLQELLEQEWQLVEATEAEKQAIIGLVKQGYDAQLSALNTSISKYKELKQAEKDAYDYQKKITDQTKNILSLEKQLAAFEANSSAESVATVQKLRADLDEAKQQVKDDQYDMYMSEMNNMLDDLSNNFQEWIDYYMKDRDRVLNDAKEYLAGSIDDLGKHSDMATAVTTFKESAVKLIEETNTDVTKISNNLTPLLEANQAVKTKVETIATGVSTIIGEFQKMVKEQSQPMVQGLDTLIATANDEASYQKQAAQNASTGSSKGTTILTPEQERKQAEEARLRAEQERIRQEDEENRRRWLAEQERIKDEEARMKAEYEAKKAEDQRLAKLEAESKKAGTYIKSIATSTTVSAKANAISAKKMSGSAAAAALAGAKLGFKKGSRRISENQWAWTQEDGTEAIYRKSDNALLTPLGAGDKVFTAGMTDNLWKLAKMNLPEMISNSFKQPIVSNSNTNARTNGGDVQFIFNLPGVKDYDSFKSALIADKSFQNAVQTMTLGAASGKNSLSKFKYS